MSEESLFGDDLPAPAPKRATKKAIREQAPEVQRRAPLKSETEDDDEELAKAIRLFAEHDMLCDTEMEKYSDIVEPVVSRESREKMKNWRQSHGR